MYEKKFVIRESGAFPFFPLLIGQVVALVWLGIFSLISCDVMFEFESLPPSDPISISVLCLGQRYAIAMQFVYISLVCKTF